MKTYTEDGEFVVDINIARELIGEGGWSYFHEFLETVNIPYTPQFHCRYAASAITRGELQLFNIDIPRFVLRLRVDSSGSFVNLRRLAEFGERLNQIQWLTNVDPVWNRFSEDLAKKGYLAFTPPAKPRDEFEQFSNISVADAVIVPPPKKCEDYDFVTTELGWPNGEARSIEGVPFVRAMPDFGGAACAQACAHMMSACLHDKPALRPLNLAPIDYFGMHGLAEVTSLVSPPMTHAMKLSGLNIDEVSQYFSALGRNAMSQSGLGSTPEDAVRKFHIICNSYVRSNLPLMFFSNNAEVFPGPPNHAMVVIGVRRNEPKNGPEHDSRLGVGIVQTTLLFNDPTGFPLQPIGNAEILQGAVFGYFDPKNNLNSLAVNTLVVLPDAVTLPLVDTFLPSSPSRVKPGLITYSEQLARPVNARNHTEYQLVFLGAPKGSRGSMFRTADYEFAGGDFCQVFENHPVLGGLKGRWVWIEKMQNAISVWLADADLSKIGVNTTIEAHRAMARRLRICTATRTSKGGTWDLSVFPPKPARVISYAVQFGRYPLSKESKKEIRRKAAEIHRPSLLTRISHKVGGAKSVNLAPAVITSFSAASLQEAADNWPKGIFYGELYAFMHRDDKLLAPIWASMRSNPKQPPAIVDLLAQAEEKKKAQKLASILSDQIRSTFEKVKEFRGFRAISTHLPQLFSPQIATRQRAQAAIRFILRIGRLLEHHYDQPLRVIELVTGSRVNGIAGGRRMIGDPCYFAYRDPSNSRIAFVVECLQELVAACAFSDMDDYSFAIEIEPGDLYSISSTPTITEFCRLVDQAGLQRRVGLNVDIGHCLLAGIPAEQIFDKPLVSRRISGFHISDQGPGHLADLPLGDCCCNTRDGTNHNLDLFSDWIRRAHHFATLRAARPRPSWPAFSGLVSVEQEAARSKVDVQHAADMVNLLVHQ